jgi:hypothetical protein
MGFSRLPDNSELLALQFFELLIVGFLVLFILTCSSTFYTFAADKHTRWIFSEQQNRAGQLFTIDSIISSGSPLFKDSAAS